MKAGTSVESRASAVDAFSRYDRELHRFLVRRLGSTRDAADVAQEVYLRLTRLEDLSSVRDPRAYLYGVATHVVLEYRARAQRDPVTFDSDTVENVSRDAAYAAPDTLAERLDTQRRLERALSSLAPTHLAVLVLHKRDGLSYEEVAGKLGLSVHTVHKYVIQAKAQVRLAWSNGE